jgi:flagellar biosynthesis protein FliQ
LLNNKFLHLYSAIIDLNYNVIIINACRGLIALINIYYKGKRVTRKVFVAKIITILLKFIIAIPFIYSLLLKGCYYIFNASY